MSDTTGRELLAKYGPTLGDVIGNLERRLSAANARIAELEDILRVKDDCLEIRMSMHDKHIMDRIPPSALKYANDLPLIIREHSVNMFFALQKATAPSQPTTLPE